MTVSRRRMIALLGGGTILAATGGFAYAVTRQPTRAAQPWWLAGGYGDVRKNALSFALLAPNPHNRQPWQVDLREPDALTLYADTDRMLPHTDPANRQITIGLGGFLEVMRMAAADAGYRVEITPFPEGENPAALDGRPIARTVFVEDQSVVPDPLFAFILDRRSTKEPYDMARAVPEAALIKAGTSVRNARFGASVAPDDIAFWRELSHEALRIEIVTPRTYMESVDLFRIGRREVEANPDGIDFSGPMFEALHLTGMFSREVAADQSSQAYQAGLDAVYANADTAMGHVWLVTAGNTRVDQLSAGADWVRLNLALNAAGIATQPLSQALQEYPEMAGPYAEIHSRLAPEGGTVQMFARVGYGPDVGQSPRWPLEAKIMNA